MSKPVSKNSQTLDKEPPQPVLIHGGAGAEPAYRFGPFRLDTSERVLRKGEEPVPLTPKAFDILLLLLRDHGRLVSKGRLMDAVWPDTFVEEKTLTQNIFTLRKVLGPDGEGRHYIETVPKHGYRFRADVEAVSQHDDGVEEKSPAGLPEEERTSPGPLTPVANQQTSAGQVARLIEHRASRPVSRAAGRRLFVLAAVVAAVVAALVVGSFYLRGGRLADRAFRKISVARLTDGADVSALALSPDGRYVAYASTRGDAQSLVVRQVETTSSVEVVPPAPVGYRGITFTRDGAWVYYVTVGRESFRGTLYRVPLLGGTPQKVLDESVGSRVEFSPDGRQVAFVHWTDRTHTALWVANVDGTGERQLAVLDYEGGFSVDGPAWSPDGKTILVPTQSYNGRRAYADVVAVNVEDGARRTLLGGRWNWIGQLTWLADGSGVVLTAWDSGSEVLSDQIWLMSYPSGEARRVTNDVNGYLGVGVSADARIIAASESTPARSFWVAPGGDWTQARRITNGSGESYSERLGLAWTPDGRIVYSTRRGGSPGVWVMEADGSGQRQLTFGGADSQPAVSPDGRQVVFVSSRAGRNQLWRVDADGSQPTLLAATEGVRAPGFTPDGQWVVYEGEAGGVPRLWRVPSGGGEPVQLTQDAALLPAVSPDGKLIACLIPNEAPGPARLTLISSEDGSVVRRFETLVPRYTPALRWSPDGRAVTYVVTREGASNVWAQPVDGGAPRALTDWKADIIYRFDWSRDGRLLAERGTTVSEVILIRDPR
ncbi:MAG TPA: winged helix-turn-helix domain-containing protein [Pyrinomonadaceae bacterium]|nr:winged helix-turn-helix domain-containing protein [Pyrinomonadaceae bacterium]